MSDVATAWAKAQQCPSPLAKQVLTLVASYADPAGEVWVLVEILALEMQRDARTAQRGLAQLRKSGLLGDTGDWKVHRGRRVPIYRLPLDQGFANTAQRLRAERSTGDSAVTPSDGAGRQGCHPTGDSAVTPRGDRGVTQIDSRKNLQNEQEARAPEVEDFDKILAAWPEVGQARTDQPLARVACARWVAEIGLAQALACVARYVAHDIDLKRGDYGAPALERWIASERWRKWLPAAGQLVAAPVFPDPEIRARVVTIEGEAFAQTYLDRCAWDAAARLIRPATGVAAQRLAPLANLLGLNLAAPERRTLGPAA